MAIVIKPLLFPRHPCREAIPLHMVCQDLYSVFKVLSFGTIILYQTFLDLSRDLLKFFLGNFYQSLNLKEVCIIVVRPMGFEPTRRFRQGILSPPWLPVPPQAHIKWRSSSSTVLAQYEVGGHSNISRFSLLLEGYQWYARWDLNPHVFRQQILSLPRLPVSARAHIKFLFAHVEIRTNK